MIIILKGPHANTIPCPLIKNALNVVMSYFSIALSWNILAVFVVGSIEMKGLERAWKAVVKLDKLYNGGKKKLQIAVNLMNRRQQSVLLQYY